MKKLLYSLTMGLALAGLTVACTTTDLKQTAGDVLVATGNDSDENRQIVSASGKVLGSVSPSSPKEERSLGGTIALNSFTTQGSLHPDQDVQEYVNLVGRAIGRRSSRPDLAWRFAVVDREDINAWAAPGGYIFITSGALQVMESESELAGVLAHEITHVTEGHMMKALKRFQFLEGTLEGAQTATDEDLSQLNQAVNEANEMLFVRGLGQNNEFEADTLGVELATAAGYDPRGLGTFLRRIGGSNEPGGWLNSTHPTTTARLQRIDAALAQNGLTEYEGAVQSERFERVVGSALK